MGPRGAGTRARLIEATVEVVGEVGYTRATTRAIAEAAGVAEGTIYRHFPDKAHLFFASVLERNTAIVVWVSQLPELAGTATVGANLRQSLRQLAALRSDLMPLELAIMADPDLRRMRADAMSRIPQPGGAGDPADVATVAPQHFIAAYLGAEQAAGRIRSDLDPARAAMIILATLFGISMLPVTDDEVYLSHIDAAVDLLLDGLLPRPAPIKPATPDA